jgi:hypothetical protein
MAIGSVGNHGAAVFGGTFGEEEIGAGLSGGAKKHGDTEEGGYKNTI